MNDKLKQTDAEFLGHSDPDKLRGPKMSSHIILILVLGLLFIALVWANYAIVDEVTSGEGSVIPSRQVQVVQNLEGGIVKKILVKEGMIVDKDQPVLIIDDTRYLASYKENLAKEDSLEITYLRLKAEVENKPFNIPQELAKNEPETVSYETKLYKTRGEQLKQLNESYNLAKKELDMTQPLIAKGAASPVEVLRLQRSIAELQGKVVTFNSETLDQLNKAKTDLAALKESIQADVDRIKRTTVRAPARGIIKQLLVVTENGVVQPGSELIHIVPLDDTLLVEAKIKPKDIGFLQPKQPAKVTITAFDYARYGALDGNVEQISADAITDEKKQQRQETYYLVKVRTQKNYLGSKENPLYIIPGMQARVDIKTGKKSVLQYILSPIIDTFNKALREK